MVRNLLLAFICLLCSVPVTAVSQSQDQQDVSLLYYSASSLYKTGDYQRALDAFLKVGVMTERDTNAFTQDTYVMSQLMAISCYQQLKQYDDAFHLCERLMEKKMTEKQRSALEYQYAYNGYFVANDYIRLERYAEAQELFNRIEPLADGKLRRSILISTAMMWFQQGTDYIMNDQFEPAMHCMEQAMKFYHELGDSSNEISTLIHLGDLKKETFNTVEALACYEKAAQMAQESRDNAVLMSILPKLSLLNERLGDVEKSTYYDLKMDSLIALSQDVNVKINYYQDRGKKAYQNGQLRLAELFYKLKDDLTNELDERDLSVGAIKHGTYLGLSNLYIEAGRYEEALEYAQKCIEVLQQNPDYIEKHDYYTYLHFADIYCHLKDSVNCFANIDSMFLSLDKLKDPQQIKTLYSTRARCHAFFGDYRLALNDYLEADRILSTEYGPLDESRVVLSALMGGVENKLSLFNESERHYQQYAEGIKALYGENSLDYARALVYLANAEGFAGHLDSGSEHYVVAVEKLKQLIHGRMPYYSSSKREGFWAPVSEIARDMTPYAVKSKQLQNAFTESCYEGLLMSKAFLLSSAQSTFDIIKRNGTAEDLKAFSTISSMKAQIGEWEKNYAAHADSILYLTTLAERLEKQLMGTCRVYGDMTSFLNVGYQQIKEQLRDNDVLIDFTDYYVKGKGREYVAYLINQSQSHPLLQVLFDQDTVSFMQAPHLDMYYEEPYAEQLCRLLWDPFKGYVQEGATVYYVPSQFLFQLAPESLPLEDGSLLGDHYRFVRLSSAREIMKVKPTLDIKADDNGCEAVLYGGLTYDIGGDIMKEEASRYHVPVLYATSRDIAHGEMEFRELPYSKAEIDSIEAILKGRGVTVESYSGINGTEESFVALSGRAPRVLHLATHGFYYSADDAQDVNYLQGYQDAMMLSGLVLSGGNAAWQGKELPDGVLGGILTANDIAKLDLTGVDMVVLSACNSGRGEMTPEGLYGLQRAFKNAGAGTVVMSLWRVSDMVGTMFMIEFFKNLADPAIGWNKREAFNKAKSHIRQNTEYSEPYYWAGFIMLD